MHSIVHAISNVAQNAIFTVDKTGMLRTQAVHSAKSCMITAALQCTLHGELNADEATFCVNAKTLLKCLRFVTQGMTVSITVSSADPDKAIVCGRDAVTGACTMEWKVPLLVEDGFNVELDTLDYKAEWLYDVKTLRNDIAHCRDLEGDDTVRLRLCVHKTQTHMRRVELESVGEAGAFRLTRGSATAPETDGDVDATAALDSAVESDSGSDEWEIVYDQQYSMGGIHDFLRCVDGPNVQLLLGKDQPLVAEVPLVGDGSKLTFVQGPHVDT
jgi:hypothetical protein